MGGRTKGCIEAIMILESKLAYADYHLIDRRNRMALHELLSTPSVKDEINKLKTFCGVSEDKVNEMLRTLDDITNELKKKKEEIDFEKVGVDILSLRPWNVRDEIAENLQKGVE